MTADPGRRSRLATGTASDLRLLFADLHNHSLLSDGRGDPEDAFRQMREAGLDVAALTDHASIPRERLPDLSLADYPDAQALAVGRLAPASIDRVGWKRTAEIADAHDVPGQFTALRGFEWTEPGLGHVNVWFSEEFTPVTSPGRIDGLHDFIAEAEPRALFGYNHPGREAGRLGGFALPDRRPELTDRMVALEAFNRTHDYLFEGHQRGDRSPVADCLDAGWRPGLIGCSDEHGPTYGLVGKGRTGVWAPAHSREGVREALLRRHTYATREVGLRLDATLDGVPMGSVLRTGRTAVLEVDCAESIQPERGGRLGPDAELQLLTSGPNRADGGIHVVHRSTARLGRPTRVVVSVPPDSRWLVLRVADPDRPPGSPTPPDHPARGWALAYASPWFLS
jgi:hypothetical protein